MEHVEKPDHSRDWKIASIRKKLTAATQEILVAKQHVVDLEEQAARIKEDLNSLSAAIMCLPPEILIEIFLLLCEGRPMDDMDDLESFCSQYPPQFRIGAVCRTWRRIAWGTSRMWRMIVISFLSKKIQSQSRLLQEWIQRSGTSLLDIYLFSEDLREADRDHYGLPFYQPPRETLNVICAAKDRWRSLHSPAFIHLQHHLGSGCATSLHELRLSNPDGECYDLDNITVPWDLRGSLHLKKLNLNMIDTTELEINWKSLTHLNLYICSGGYQHFLKELSALESFVVFHEDLDDNEDPLSFNQTGTFHTLPNLTRLSLRELGAKTTANLLSYLTAPKLKDVSLSPQRIDDPMQWMQTIIQFITRSSCPLENMDVYKIPAAGVAALVEHIRTVTRFSAQSFSSSFEPIPHPDALLDTFNISRHRKCLPELEELILKGNFSEDIDTLLEMIKSRVQPPPSEDDQPQVKKIRKIDITYEHTLNLGPSKLESFYDEVSSLSASTSTLITVTFDDRY
ncbi:hypothetical protein D9613_011011 [Agrocybe pediades]|uniref:F-box domain-containing protein n=1 Tax=Agrocybe pediades TaxID=84607 RepID=A0A8H4QLC9_9AGAR|nr:hypothetical protein D9613_011011 [Agrocybe pediades]